MSFELSSVLSAEGKDLNIFNPAKAIDLMHLDGDKLGEYRKRYPVVGRIPFLQAYPK